MAQVKVALLLLLLMLAPAWAWAAPEAGRYGLVGARSDAHVMVDGPTGEARASVPASGTLEVGPDGRIVGGLVDLDLRALKADPLVARALRAPDGFDVRRHPAARFTVTGGAFDGDAARIEGRLRLRGVERPLTLSGEVVRARRGRLTLVLTGAFDRTAFGVVAGRPLFGREARVRVRLVAAR